MQRFFRETLRSFGYAGAGIMHLLRTQRNARIHLALTALALALGFWLHLSTTEWAIITLLVGLVIGTEALNTAIEATIDLLSPEPHPLAKIAKDTAAAAVLIAAIVAIVVAVLLLLPKVWALASI